MNTIQKVASSTAEAKKFERAMRQLGMRVSMRATGTWICEDGEALFARDRGCRIDRMRGQWITVLADGGTYRARQDTNSGLNNESRIVVYGEDAA